MKLPLIIPIYNESEVIDRCRANLRSLRGEVEILFADGGSTDDTLAKIGDAYRVISCPKGLPGQIITSGRRYRTNHPLLTMFYLRGCYRAGMDIHEIARRYRDIR